MTSATRQWLILGVVLVLGVVTGLAATVGRGGLEVHGPIVVSERSWWSGFTPSGGLDAVVAGVLAWDGECLLLSGSPVVWPHGTRWDSDRQVLRFEGGEARIGDHVSGGGGWSQPQYFKDSDIRNALERCDGESNEIGAFNRDEILEVNSSVE